MSLVKLGNEAWNFAQMDSFWREYRPLSPWAKDEADKKPVFRDGSILKSRYDDIERALLLLKNAKNSAGLDRITYHLKRMPRLPLEAKESYELIELFQVKKFMANYRGLVSAMDTEAASFFGLEPFKAGSKSRELAALLDSGGSDPETFFLADSFDPELKEARAGMAACDSLIIKEKQKREAKVRLDFGISFDGRDFIILAKDKARALAGASNGGAICSLEPYDDSRFMARLLPSPLALEAMAEREGWLARERKAETRVLAFLSLKVAEAMPEIKAAVKAVSRWDRARAGAELAIKYNMSRPVLDSKRLELVSARFIPCEAECSSMGLAYTPLTASFGSNAVVLFGSNMGGKTVVLKTVLFFQLLAQAGLFVPAKVFCSRLYDSISYVGELDSERLAGLSGFGMEVWRLESAWKDSKAEGQAALVAFDELARTTGSHEAEALLSAVIEAQVKHGLAGMAFYATHFRGVARLHGAEYRRMRGLDRSALSLAMAAQNKTDHADENLDKRLAGINRFMRYEIIDDECSVPESDALAIASLLGLDNNIVDRARFYLGKKEDK